jgi:two-component system nitrogen regulation response regulator GlnG
VWRQRRPSRPAALGWETWNARRARCSTPARPFEARLIVTALASTRGRRIEAAHKLGIGRNTITRKIQELGLDE